MAVGRGAIVNPAMMPKSAAVFKSKEKGLNIEKTKSKCLEFDSRSLNEGFVRVAVAAFATQLNPTLEEVADLKTAVSEAVTNAIIHAYGGQAEKIRVNCRVREREMEVEVVDHGVGIRDVPKAMEPMYTTKPELDRSGMGFAFMEAFMDELQVRSEPGVGTTVWMKKKFGCQSGQSDLSGEA